MIRPIVFRWCARPDCFTSEAVHMALQGYERFEVDLSLKKFSDYDPTGQNLGDDFLEMAERMVQHNPIILACPVYWYNVPAIMKKFIDRWSDLLDARKDLGRKLQGKSMMVITSHENYPTGIDGFEAPLKNTAEYMGMNYKGSFFYYTGTDEKGLAGNSSRLETFRLALAAYTNSGN